MSGEQAKRVGRPSIGAAPARHVGVRIPDELRARVEEIRARLAEAEPDRRVTDADAIRYAIERAPLPRRR